MPSLPSIDHLALTVTDVERSVAFYSALWGTEPSATLTDGPFVRRKFDLGAGLGLGLTQHAAGQGASAFDALKPGLDHVGFAVDTVAELREWAAHLEHLGVEHSGLVEAGYGTVLSFKDPDGIALEFFAAS